MNAGMSTFRGISIKIVEPGHKVYVPLSKPMEVTEDSYVMSATKIFMTQTQYDMVKVKLREASSEL